MNESQIEGVAQNAYKPSTTEFANFAKYIRTLEEKNISFALVFYYVNYIFLFIFITYRIPRK